MFNRSGRLLRILLSTAVLLMTISGSVCLAKVNASVTLSMDGAINKKNEFIIICSIVSDIAPGYCRFEVCADAKELEILSVEAGTGSENDFLDYSITDGMADIILMNSEMSISGHSVRIKCRRAGEEIDCHLTADVLEAGTASEILTPAQEKAELIIPAKIPEETSASFDIHAVTDDASSDGQPSYQVNTNLADRKNRTNEPDPDTINRIIAVVILIAAVGITAFIAGRKYQKK